MSLPQDGGTENAMDRKIRDILNGREENYIFPFYWQRGDHTHLIPEQMKRIYSSGCRAVCVESRPHPDFCGESWWRDFGLILQEAKKLGMKVWLLDDDQFPTGHAAGWIAKKYPEKRKWLLHERHIDVVGPAASASIIVDPDNEENILIGAYAYKRNADDLESCAYEAVNLTDKINGSYLTWDIPEGVWRIFFYYRSRSGGLKEYIDMIDADSVHVLIEAVYESHYEHFKEYFGDTFAGFFSDEPGLGNLVCGEQRFNFGFYESRIGKPALALPWNDTVLGMMAESLGFDPRPHLNLLWYEDDENGDRQAEIRFAYMDAVTRLYGQCFTKQLSDWCHAHGVMYIGHIIEDENCHMSGGVGHYMRALEWQDMSGIDIVLHQVMPGMQDYIHTSTCATGVCNGSFFHYILAKLAASLAHLTPHMKGRAMCEVFGAFGYGEDTVFMKYLMDFLLVRGINHFVPHAFSSKFPDADCPPHFGAEGHDPSFEGFSALMAYTNKAAHLLSDTKHIANAAILYHVENEWASRFMNATNMQPAAKALYDAHIDFDIVWLDILKQSTVKDGKLRIAEECFDALVIPYADHFPAVMLAELKRLQEEGLLLIFAQDLPENADFEALTAKAEDIPHIMRERGMSDVTVEEGYPALRIYHCTRDGQDIFMFANEDYAKTVDTTVTLPVNGAYARIDLLNERYTAGMCADGAYHLSLLPNQSEIVVFGDTCGFEPEYVVSETVPLSPSYELALAECDNLSHFETVGTFHEFFNVTSPDFKPDFSGKMRYTFRLEANRDARHILLDLGEVGQNASLKVNGRDCGIRITKPYVFDITEALGDGVNTCEVTVSNTLAQKVKDHFSKFLQLSPSGMLGGVTLKYVK